ncbi:hypothetical protein J6590_029109 [Homalodisca vitripennis]|nr:hypothetical protein J6590_029109 [Homalodisca vitripennis]
MSTPDTRVSRLHRQNRPHHLPGTSSMCKHLLHVSRLESARPTYSGYVHSRHSSVTPTPSELTSSSPREHHLCANTCRLV